MFNPMQVNQMLKNLEELLRREALTPARFIEADTFICFTEVMQWGMAYHQGQFNDLPQQIKDGFKNRVKGERIGQYKIVAIYDVWPSALDTPLVKKNWNS